MPARALASVLLLLLLAPIASADVGSSWSLIERSPGSVVADFDAAPGLEIASFDPATGTIEILETTRGQVLTTITRQGFSVPTMLPRDVDGDGLAELVVLWSAGDIDSALGAYDVSGGGPSATELWYRTESFYTLGEVFSIDGIPPFELYMLRGSLLTVLDATTGTSLYDSQTDPDLPTHDVQEVDVVDLDADGDDELLVTALDPQQRSTILFVVDGLNPTAAPEGATAAGARATLFPNSPNPAGSTTRLSFALPEAGRVRLRVFDSAGREVRSLVDEWRRAGRHQVSWDGRDHGGFEVASGVYFYELRLPDQTTSRKMLMLR